MNIIRMKDVTQQEWDGWVRCFPDASYYHSWVRLNYATKMKGFIENESFVMYEEQVVCPLMVFCDSDGSKVLSSGTHPLGVPIFNSSLTPHKRRKLQVKIMSYIEEYASKHSAREIQMVWYPSTYNLNSFDLLRYGFDYRVENTVMIDLYSNSVEELEKDLSANHFRQIKKSRSVQLDYVAYRIDISSALFASFQSTHFNASGRLTRPQATWDELRAICLRGDGTLFVAFHYGSPISYLFCGEFDQVAFAWSQVNVKEYTEEHKPRHFLEWQAILHYKNRNFKWYEVGDRLFGSNHGYVPTDKELSLSFFRERFGGVLLPRIYWSKKLEENKNES